MYDVDGTRLALFGPQGANNVRTNDPGRPPAQSWGFHAASRDDRRDVDAILLIDADPDVCRLVAHHLARSGYSVEWTVNAAMVPARVSARRYALLLAEDVPSGVAMLDPQLPTVHLGKPIDPDALLAVVAARVRRSEGSKP